MAVINNSTRATDNYGETYWRDAFPFRKVQPWSEYPTLKPLWKLPRTVIEAVQMGMFPKGGIADVMPQHRITIMTQLLMAKDHGRTHRTFSAIGHIYWVEFTAIEPCWFLLDEEDDYRLLSETEYGQPRPAQFGPGA